MHRQLLEKSQSRQDSFPTWASVHLLRSRCSRLSEFIVLETVGLKYRRTIMKGCWGKPVQNEGFWMSKMPVGSPGLPIGRQMGHMPTDFVCPSEHRWSFHTGASSSSASYALPKDNQHSTPWSHQCSLLSRSEIEHIVIFADFLYQLVRCPKHNQGLFCRVLMLT